MTDKPAMTIEEVAQDMVLELYHDRDKHVQDFMLDRLTRALTEAYARGRRDGLKESASICDENPRPAMWVSERIRALIEKET